MPETKFLIIDARKGPACSMPNLSAQISLCSLLQVDRCLEYLVQILIEQLARCHAVLLRGARTR